MSILDLLRSDGSIVINKNLARGIGLNETVILAEIISLYIYHRNHEKPEMRLDKEGFYYCTIEKLESHTTLKRSVQDKAIDSLCSLGLISKEMKGIPAKRHFTIHEARIAEFLLGGELASLVAEKQQPDNNAGSKPKKPKKAPSNQVVEKQQPSLPEKSNTVGRKKTTSNTDSNTELKEEEEDTPTQARLNSQMIEQDIKTLTTKYPQYEQITELIGASAILNRRPVFFEEETFLEKAAAIRVHPRTLLEIYQSISAELERKSGSRYIYDLLDNVFKKFERALKSGSITYGAAAWFHTTWFNEIVQFEQAAMLEI